VVALRGEYRFLMEKLGVLFLVAYIRQAGRDRTGRTHEKSRAANPWRGIRCARLKDNQIVVPRRA
jgi:hypothetical protein